MSDEPRVDLSPAECALVQEAALWWQARCDAVGREVPRDLLLAALDLALTCYRSTVRAELEEACQGAQNAHTSQARH